MKKYLLSALALPLLFACSTDDFEKPVASNNDPYPGIEKVNATFYMDEGPVTRMETKWGLENGDLYGFAWMGDGEVIEPGEGIAYQNHNLIQTNGIFQPQTSIYVGDYFIYRPYDFETVSPQEINFSLAAQPMALGYPSTGAAWKALAKSAIIIADKWTNILPEGRTYAPDTKIWDQPGIDKPYKVFAAFFSNQTGLDLRYTNNNPEFGDAGQHVVGATDIDYTETGSAGAADIYGATVKLTGAANSFTYGPEETPNDGDHAGTFWTNKTKADACIADACTFADGDGSDVITLTAPVGKPIEAKESTGWFWFNSLPVITGDGATVATPIVATVKTSYGTVTIDKNIQANPLTIGDCAWVFEDPDGDNWEADGYSPEWMKLVAEDAQDLTPLTNKRYGIHNNTFVNQFGNHKGKYVLDVDFSTAVMDIHITNDTHLQKYLKFYIASGKNNGANLVLDGDANNEFKLSKISIALLQTINAGKDADKKVLVAPCTIADEDHMAPENGRVKIVVTQDGQADANLKAVPTLYDVFATTAVFTEEAGEVEVAPVPVYLSKDCTWTWGDNIVTTVGGVTTAGMLKIDEQVASITNEGTLNVTNENVQLSVAGVPLYNAAIGENGAVMNFTAVTTVKNPLTNLGVINIAEGAELRAYDVAVTNDATSLTAFGRINNSGVIGTTFNTDGVVNNYGLIDMKTQDAMTLLTRNQTANANTSFKNAFNAETNKLGTVILPDNNPIAIVSVSNAPETGFIKYRWPADAGNVYETPAGIVKYNTVIVSDDIAIADVESELKYIEFDNSAKRISFTNPDKVNGETAVYLPSLKGIIITAGTKVLLEKTNKIVCGESAYLGNNAVLYNGGKFTMANAIVDDATKVVTNYLGEWSTNQIVKW